MPQQIFRHAIDLIAAYYPGDILLMSTIVDAIECGSEPTELQLQSAPVLSNCRLHLIKGYPFLVGQVSNHPRIPDGPVVTSLLCAIDASTPGWARTKSRFYSLAHPPERDFHGLRHHALETEHREHRRGGQ